MDIDTISDGIESINLEEFVLSIDIGLKHLALVLSRECPPQVFCIKLVDISVYTHNTINKNECKLFHTKTIADWVKHLIQEEKEIFEGAKHILLERQPIGSPFISIEQLIFYIYRDKTWLISPKSVHCFFGFQGLSYEQRKVASEIISRPILSQELNSSLSEMERAHDVCDAILQFYYWCDNRKKERDDKLIAKKKAIEEERIREFKQNFSNELELKRKIDSEREDAYKKYKNNKNLETCLNYMDSCRYIPT